MICGFIIWTMVSIMFLFIGITCGRSKKPVGFFTGAEPPEIKDVEGYNRAVARLWYTAAVVMELVGIPLLFLEQNSPGFIIVLFIVPFGVIAMCISYLKIEHKYRK